MKSVGYKILAVLAMFLLIVTVFPHKTYGDFGSSSGFGELDEEFVDFAPVDPPFFIHDTLPKLVFLILFGFAAIIVLCKKRSLRKPLLFLSLLILGFYYGGFLCPFISVQNVIINYNTGFILLFLVPTMLALVLGRIFCGYMCAFGALQEFVHRSRLRIKLPLKTLKLLQKAKYFFLAYLIVRVLVTNSIILIGYTPFKAFFSLGGRGLSIILSLLIIIIALFIYRPFCQFLCPLGAWLGLCSIPSKFSILPQDCIKCSKCQTECLLAANSKGKIDLKECILCGKCSKACIMHN